MDKIRLLIVDDHAVLRAGLKLLINTQPDMEVVDEASDGLTAVQKAIEKQPDLVLMDISMPEASGISALERIRQDCPHTRVLVLTMHDDPAYLRAVFAAGAGGYAVKKASHLDLLVAIRAVYRGRTFVDVAFTEDDFIAGGKAPHGKKSMLLLSPREREVLGLVAQGYMNKHIAERLRLSVKSVETYRARVSGKLGLRSRADVIRYALEVGLLSAGTFPPGDSNMHESLDKRA